MRGGHCGAGRETGNVRRDGLPVIAIAGQPNSGKSTLFNALAGYRAISANFPGTTVSHTRSDVVIDGRRAHLVDLPGAYSLSPSDPAERVARDYLLSGQVDAVLLVLDASTLTRGIGLALEVIELGLPLVVAANMMDEAGSRGIVIDVPSLAARLGVPVVPTVAVRVRGVAEAAGMVMDAASAGLAPPPPAYAPALDRVVRELAAWIPSALVAAVHAPPRYVALRLLESDPDVEHAARQADGTLLPFAEEHRDALVRVAGQTARDFVSVRRHEVASDIFSAVARTTAPGKRPFGDRLDAVLMHPVLGLLLAVIAMAALFVTAFFVGDFLAGIVAIPFDALGEWLGPLAEGSLLLTLVRGLVDGIAAGAGIVLPYLLPLLVLMALYEDFGYLPRVAFLIDGLFHRIGLHGKSVVPLILSYGCSVPALMATRILESPRDRVLTGLLAPLLPCSARTVVIFGVVAAFMGPQWALAIFAINLVVAGVVGRVLSSVVGGSATALVMEVPPYRVPVPAAVAKKVWFRVRDFLVNAWPILVVASVVMSGLEYAGVADAINAALRPLTVGLLGLPVAVGVTLVFGFLRKELALLLLFQALGTVHLSGVMTAAQMMGFTLFIVFYVPCVATVATLARELGWRWAGASAALKTGIAVLAAAVVHFAAG